MYLPLRTKILLVAAGAAVIALGTALWAVSYQLERRMADQIADRLAAAESTFLQWKDEHRAHLSVEARIVAHDPRFFAAVAEGDEATALPIAREFQAIAASDLFLVCDERGRRLAHLGAQAAIIEIDWPQRLPPVEDAVQWDDRLYLLQSQAVTVGMDTLGYVALGMRVNEELAHSMGRIAGADVLFFDDHGVFGSTLSPAQSLEYLSEFKASGASSSSDAPGRMQIGGDRVLTRVGRLTDSPGAAYAVVMSLDRNLAPQIGDLRRTVLWVGLLALAFAFAVSWSVARRVTARIPQLVAAVEAVAHGQYDRPVSHDAHDELRAVAEAVDRMRHELADQIEAIHRAEAERIASERLAVIGKMSSSIIHDFKTPMQVIRTAVELSSAASASESKRAEYARMILRELDRMVRMAQDLMSFARGERQMSRTVIDLVAFMEAAVANWRQIGDAKGLRVEFECPLANFAMAVDEIKLRRALDNIVINAVEALAPGGRIEVVCRQSVDDVVIRIADNGPGIPPEFQAAIFEPFATFGKANGTGLGLAMARKAIEDHGGAISFETAPSTGTTFTVTLPLPAVDGLREHTENSEESYASTTA